ncbi:MAG: NAD-dependent succinate-semialdehyde dehydrogenase [Desulfosarcina sp.]
MTLQTINPTTGKVVNQYDAMNARQLQERIQAAQSAYQEWRRSDMSRRVACLREAGLILANNKEQYAKLMALEMGKPIRDGRAEIDKCALLCRFVAETAAQTLAPEIVQTEARKSFVSFQPVGLILGIMPWNYPFWQVFRFAAPAMMAGNAILLKHASGVTGSSLAIEQLMHQAGFPRPLFHTLLVSGQNVQPIIDHPAVKAVTLTGSKTAGQAVAAQAGKWVKKTVLELGGSDPYLILEDADLDLTVEACTDGRLLNSGQSCIAAKRFIVVQAVKKEFEERLVEKMKTVRMGDPLDENTRIGPMARGDLRDTLHRQVRESIDKGADCRLGGTIPKGKGFFYPPTVLTGVHRGMPAFDQETFGPVAAIVSAADESEAIRLANDTDFGLGAAVFTRDLVRGERIAAEWLEAGNCFVNAFVKSDPRLPFGGIKESGYGRELSHYGFKEFVNIKTVYVE